MHIRNEHRQAAVAAVMTVAALGMGSSAMAEDVYGVTSTGALVRWDRATPGSLTTIGSISGLQFGEEVEGIDFRPANGQLYALGSSSRLYTINLNTAQALEVGAPGAFAPLLNGSNFGFDFNPTVDRIRITSDAEQNLRAHPDTGDVVFADGALSYAPGDFGFQVDPYISFSAYTNNFAGSTSTTLYNLDSDLNTLVTQSPPNNGTLNTVGALGINFDHIGGFDIASSDNMAFAALRTGVLPTDFTKWYSINLSTGQATLIGDIGGGVIIRAMSIVIPGPGALALLGMAGLIGSRRRRS